MRQKFMLLTVSPLVIFLALIQADCAMASVTTVVTTEVIITDATMLVDAYAANANLGLYNTKHIEHPLLSMAIFQITSTVPPSNLAPPQLGPSAIRPATRPLTIVETITATDTPTDTPTISLVEALNEPLTTVQVIDEPQVTSVQVTETQVTSAQVAETPTSTVESISTVNDASSNQSTADDTTLDVAYSLPIEGTIIANRTDANIRFFVEGATYDLTVQRSIGLGLPRVTAVLNLFNCDAATPESTDGCFWDPYLLDRDGFYEIIEGSTSGELADLTLKPAGSPPVNQIWLQNRTGTRESIFFQGEEVIMPPASIREFSTEANVPAIFYLRSCLILPDRTVCEWTPTGAEAGFYYALEENNIPGSLPDSEIIALTSQPILSNRGEPIEAPPQVNCELQVPVLNVRSGPGLAYQIIDKIRGTDQTPGRVNAIGRDDLGDWLAVDERIAAGGWAIASPNFIRCNGDINSLPVAEVTDGRLTPTPEPITVAPPIDTSTADTSTADTSTADTSAVTAVVTETQGENAGSEGDVAAEPTTPASQSIPEGLALIIVNNGFEQQMRFTLDQRYRVESGPSEFDLQPSESVSMLVFPGQVSFSASSPWRGLSGNADFLIEAESRTLWVTFIPDPDGSGDWFLQY